MAYRVSSFCGSGVRINLYHKLSARSRIDVRRAAFRSGDVFDIPSGSVAVGVRYIKIIKVAQNEIGNDDAFEAVNDVF